MEAGSVSSASSESNDEAQPEEPTKEEVGATPQDGFSMGSVSSALQQAAEATPDPAGPPDNPASPSGSETLAEAAQRPASPAMPAVEVVGSTPPASKAAAAKSTSSANPAGQDLGLLEVECREALRTQWLSFPYQPGEAAASTLSLDTLAVWPDGGELDLTLTLEESLRPDERRLLATGPAAAPENDVPPRPRKPITSEDGLYCLACGQRAPSIEHMSGHLMTSAHVRAVKAYLAK